MPSTPSTPTQNEPLTMRCMEVWGGNHAVDNGVVMAGLDAWLYSRPFHDQSAGGDLHYVSSCAMGMVTRVLVADVSGHGEAVSGAANSLRGLMRRYVNYVDQTHFVRGLNAEFGALSQAGGFATAVVATYFAPTDDFRLCNAGHPRPLLYRARARAWSLMDDVGGGGPGPPTRRWGSVRRATTRSA
jgi:serine phosphatase RsbU (regulator of sigma subunit)